jgi:hypothetical protein
MSISNSQQSKNLIHITEANFQQWVGEQDTNARIPILSRLQAFFYSIGYGIGLSAGVAGIRVVDEKNPEKMVTVQIPLLRRGI